jgi:hypothetical protein
MGKKTFENLIIVILVIAIIYMLFKNDIKPNFIKNEVINRENDKKVSFNDKLQEIVIENKEIKDEDEISGHDWVEDYEQLNDFVKEYKDYGRFSKGNVGIEKGNDMEINAYRKSFLDFRNYTNNTSNGFDAVDNMNLEKLQDNSKGMKVSDVYDKITANNYKESNIDIVGMQHNEIVDNTVRSNVFQYDSDTVNNGAFFFDKVTGYDNESHDSAF